MNRALTALLIILLAAGTIFNGVMLVQTNNNANQTKTQVSSLSSTTGSAQTSLSQAQSTETALQSSITSLQNSVSQLNSAVQTSSMNVAAVVSKIQPVVVYVAVSGRNFSASGSGVIISSQGYVLTNQHVIDQATSITVTLATDLSSGSTFTATVVKSNADLDLAVLKLTNPPANLPVATLGAATDAVVGETVVTCGFPLGTDLPGTATFTAGIVSAIRTMPSMNTNNPAVNINYVQIDAPINPGNSGGGLFTLSGKFIGVPAYGFEDPTQNVGAGINMAIPMDTVLPFIQGYTG